MIHRELIEECECVVVRLVEGFAGPCNASTCRVVCDTSNVCATGYRGRLCSQCGLDSPAREGEDRISVRYFRDSEGECEACHSTKARSQTLVVFVCTGVLVVVVLLLVFKDSCVPLLCGRCGLSEDRREVAEHVWEGVAYLIVEILAVSLFVLFFAGSVEELVLLVFLTALAALWMFLSKLRATTGDRQPRRGAHENA